jgi:16S rRNA (adenine1518-N6/adenine1519-N6)-dimethyltransferase
LDPFFLERIADQAQIQPGETVLEIGAGTGALTVALARRGARVLAIEIDPLLLPVLRETTIGCPHVHVIPGDALRTDLDGLTAAVAGLSAPYTYKIVSNLPYAVSTPLLTRIMTRASHWNTAVLTLQDEVARKLTASPGTDAYGVLTLTAQIFGSAQILFHIPAQAFVPIPAVESAAVRLTRRVRFPETESETEAKSESVSETETEAKTGVEAEADLARLNALIRAAFGKRRKTVANALKGVVLPETYENWPDALTAAGIDPRRRGETLSLDEYIRLARLC